MNFIIVDKAGVILDCIKDIDDMSKEHRENFDLGDTKAIEASDDHMEAFKNDPRGFGGFLFSDGELTPRPHDKPGQIHKKRNPEQLPIEVIDSDGHLMNEASVYFGKLWFKRLFFPEAGNVHEGHKHKHDHVSLLISGSVLIEVEGFKPKKFTAPAEVIIKKEHIHQITALEDNTLWYCAYYIDDDSLEEYYGPANSPYTHPDVVDR